MDEPINENHRLNKVKVIVTIIIVIFLVATSTVLGINYAEKKESKRCFEQLQKLEEQARIIEKQREEQRILEEQKKKEEERLARIAKTEQPLSQDAQYNIMHIYNDTGEKRAFLTFDDGPSKQVTPLILDLLKKEQVPATFFVLGVNAQYNQELIKREFEEGHYVANHGFSHRYAQVYSSPEATLDEYNRTEQIIRDALGNQNYMSNLFRFPGGSNGGSYHTAKQASKALLREKGITYLDWNSLSQDAAGSYTKEQLLQNTIDTIGENESVIILMHDASDKILTYEMLPDLINYLRENGYSFKNIYDII